MSVVFFYGSFFFFCETESESRCEANQVEVRICQQSRGDLSDVGEGLEEEVEKEGR